MVNNQFVHKVIVFNKKNPHHKQLLDWINQQTTNFSAYGLETLSMRREGFRPSNHHVVENTNIEGWL